MLEEDVPFGAVEEKPSKKRSAVIGIVVLVVMLIGSLAVTKFMPSGAQEFSVDKVDVESEQQIEVTYIYVHVVGCVVSPGVVGISKDARLIDAVNAAGGFTEDANTESLNLARQVTDGEQIRVSSIYDVQATDDAATTTTSSGID